MVQNILVTVIVAGALVYVARQFYRTFKKTGSSGCGCGCSCGSGCGCAGGDDAHSCNSFEKYFLEDGCREGSRRPNP